MWRRADVSVGALEQLADADAFQSLGLSRRQALWAIRGLDDTELPLMRAAGPPAIPAQAREPGVTLRSMTPGTAYLAASDPTRLPLQRLATTATKHKEEDGLSCELAREQDSNSMFNLTNTKAILTDTHVVIPVVVFCFVLALLIVLH